MGARIFSRLFVSAVLLLNVIPGVLSIPTPAEEPLRPRQAPFTVTGVLGSGVQVRKSLYDLNEAELNILLLAWRRFQDIDQNDDFSYYRIAGIHGEPFRAWRGFQGVPGGERFGYCPHLSPLFITWHRPYLALFEQLLHGHAQAIAAEFPPGPDRDRYMQAAATLRLPYWDWAANPRDGAYFPRILAQQVVQVRSPRGPISIPNPLYSYRFHPLNQNEISLPYLETVRYPADRNPQAVSQHALVNQDFQRNYGNIRNRLYALLTTYNDYSRFSNGAWARSNRQNADCLECLHDLVHDTIGHNGHMFEIVRSAFDPIFWLHHCNVDRIFAMWQVLNPGSYLAASPTITPTFAVRAGTMVDANFPLSPFPGPGGRFWTSAQVRSTLVLGYTYPEVGPAGLQANPAAVRTAINQLYGSALVVRQQKRELVPVKLAMTEYVVNIRSQKYTKFGTYFVHVTIGQSAVASGCPSMNSVVGSHAVNARTDVDLSAYNLPDVTGSVYLTSVLQERVVRGELASMDRQHVLPYLTERLNWTVFRSDGSCVTGDKVPGFKLGLATYGLNPPPTFSDFPTLQNNYKVHTDVTCKKLGGVIHEDDI